MPRAQSPPAQPPDGAVAAVVRDGVLRFGSMLGRLHGIRSASEGRFDGRLLSVTVYDNFGGTHHAAAIDIEAGPRTMRGDTGIIAVPEGEDTAMLCPVGVAIIDPDELGVVGSRVKVSGRMLMADASSSMNPRIAE